MVKRLLGGSDRSARDSLGQRSSLAFLRARGDWPNSRRHDNPPAKAQASTRFESLLRRRTAKEVASECGAGLSFRKSCLRATERAAMRGRTEQTAACPFSLSWSNGPAGATLTRTKKESPPTRYRRGARKKRQ